MHLTHRFTQRRSREVLGESHEWREAALVGQTWTPLCSSARVCVSVRASYGRYVLLMIYAYLFWLAGKRVNYALVHVENKFDVARTLGGALMCLTVPLATYQVRVRGS